MVRINFTIPGSDEMILSGRKNTTIRMLKSKRRREMENSGKLELYYGPRYSKEQIKIADAYLVRIRDIHVPLRAFIDSAPFSLIDGEGFDSKTEMKTFFVKQYGEYILDECTFSMIEWRLKERRGDPRYGMTGVTA